MKSCLFSPARSAKCAESAKRGEIVTSGGRVLGAVAVEDTLEDAVAHAYRLADRVDFANKYCRRDIGARALAADRTPKGE